MKNWGLRRIKCLARSHTASKQQDRKFSPIPRLLCGIPLFFLPQTIFYILIVVSVYLRFFLLHPYKIVSKHTPTSTSSHSWSVQLNFHRVFFGYVLPFPNSLHWAAFWNVFSLQNCPSESQKYFKNILSTKLSSFTSN